MLPDEGGPRSGIRALQSVLKQLVVLGDEVGRQVQDDLDVFGTVGGEGMFRRGLVDMKQTMSKRHSSIAGNFNMLWAQCAFQSSIRVLVTVTWVLYSSGIHSTKKIRATLGSPEWQRRSGSRL